jgi:polyhydroxyalkanoate synthase subunit PhaC
MPKNAKESARWAAPHATPPEHYTYVSIDRAFNANLARWTLGLSPAALLEQNFDWLAHLALSPGKQLQLVESCMRLQARFLSYAARTAISNDAEPLIVPGERDRRFQNEGWQRWPYNVLMQGFLVTQHWWNSATTDVEGVSKRHERGVSFTTRQLLDTLSPSNFVWTNPEVAEATLEQGGRNLVRGSENFLEDWWRRIDGQPPIGAEEFGVGTRVATTPGKVVLQNHLFELIQYAPMTPTVYAEPVLIVPAWIMKYYILDLSPHNSLVRYLVEHGHTVFIMSWRNPDSSDRDLAMADYQRALMTALNAIGVIVPSTKIHAVGYCLGGTLLLIAAAAMGRDGDARLATLTLLAAQGDFSEAGEITLLTDESEVAYLEDMMWDRGYLDTYQMAGAFQMLRSNDLIWSRYVREYLLGGRQEMSDLMAWNADATRMPYRMHSEYLHRLLLDNELATGRYEVDGRPVSLSDIRVPSFAVGTLLDHVAPWPSVFKVHLVLSAGCEAGETVFLLTSGGHNAGIVSEPGHPGRTYQMASREPQERFVDPATWERDTPVQEGSWWPAWEGWLAAHSTGSVAPPAVGAPDKGYAIHGDAPGTYVHQP